MAKPRPSLRSDHCPSSIGIGVRQLSESVSAFAGIRKLLLNDCFNPFALALVDVPSSGKTITLNFFEVPELSYPTDAFSPAAFVSHSSNVGRDELDKVDLLPRIRFRTMIVRDLAPIFGAKEDDLLKTLGILTRVLDGEGLQIESGVHGSRGYQGDYLFMLLAGATPIPPRVFKLMGTLGSRLLFLSLQTPSKSHDELIAQNRASSRRQSERVCRDVTTNLLRTLWQRYPNGLDWQTVDDPESCLRVIARCAKLLACLRGTIQTWSDGGDAVSLDVGSIEHPDRINCLLHNLARGHALLSGRDQLSDEDMAPVLEVTFDSAPTLRAKVFRALADNGGELRTSEVEVVLGASKPTALKVMAVLDVLGVAEKIKIASQKPEPPPPPPTDEPQDEWKELARKIEAKEGRSEHLIRLAAQFGWFASDECKALRWKGVVA